MSYRGRFAPSPTGDLHGGSLVAALGSWLRARQAGGRWLVRMEDLDPPRVVPGAAASILDTLRDYGLVSDDPVLYQSQRSAAYQEAFDRLHAQGEVFPCWCSRRDLAAHDGMHRDGHCVTPPLEDRPPAWRLRVPARTVAFHDALQGPQEQDLRQAVGDFVLRRADGCWSYHLACVVDDAFQGISEVVRGCDLLDSTPRQIHLQQRLGLPTPDYLHLPLALRADAGKLSKSTRDLPLDREAPLPTLHRALRFLGMHEVPGACVDRVLEAAVERFDLHRIVQRQRAAWPDR
jgi:glutamyl-Q tRNA(Asp) synthetase